jgi:hypothetical protein
MPEVLVLPDVAVPVEVLALPEVAAPLEVLVEPPDPLSALGLKRLLILIGSGLDMSVDLIFSG